MKTLYTFLNSRRKNDVGNEVEFTFKVDVSVKKNSLLVCVLKFLGILAGQCGNVVVRERD